MRRPWIAPALIGCCGCLPALSARAQDDRPPPPTELPGITVTAPYTSLHGGYLISGDFKVDPRMTSVVFPAQAGQPIPDKWRAVSNCRWFPTRPKSGN